MERRLCRDHGVAVSKSFVKYTVVHGWGFGLHFFFKFFVVAADLAAWGRYARLAAPEQPAPRAS